MFDSHFHDLLTLVPALEGCVKIQNTSYETATESPYDIYYYSNTDSNEVIDQPIKVKTYKMDEHADDSENDDDESFEEEDIWRDEIDELEEMMSNYELVPVKPTLIKEQFQTMLGREEDYFLKLLDETSIYELLPSYTVALKNTSLKGRADRIEQIVTGDALYLCNAAGEQDEDVGIGAPCIAVCAETGTVGVLGTQLSETLLSEVAGLTLEEDEDQNDYTEANQRLQALATVTATDVKPLSKMRKGSKNPAVQVTITIANSLMADRLTQETPVLDNYRRKLREKRTKSL